MRRRCPRARRQASVLLPPLRRMLPRLLVARLRRARDGKASASRTSPFNRLRVRKQTVVLILMLSLSKHEDFLTNCVLVANPSRRLLVGQRDHGIEPRRLARRRIAEDQTGCGRAAERQ